MKILPIIGLLLAFFVIGTIGNESVGREEAHLLWVVRDVTPLEPAAPGDFARGMLNNAREMLDRSTTLAQPPLYVLLLDGWTMVTGDSAFAARTLSVLCVLVAIAAAYRIFARLSNSSAALTATVLLATSILMIYPARNISPFGLLAALIALATLVYLRRPGVVYVLLMTAVLMTDPIGLWLIAAHSIMEFRRVRPRLRWFAAVFAAAFVLFAWMFLMSSVIDWSDTLNRMLLALGLLLLPLMIEVVLSLVARRPKEMRSAVLLLVIVQLAAYVVIFPPKPRWLHAVEAVMAARNPLEPAITAFEPDSPLAYYDELLHFRQGISLNLSWKRHSPAEIQSIVSKVANPRLAIWVIMPTDLVETWDVMAELGQTHDPAYYDSVDGVVFYRFDPKGE